RSVRTQDVVEDGVEEGLGLARTGAGGDERGGRPPDASVRRKARQATERGRLVSVRREAVVPPEGVAPTVLRRPERQPQPDERPLEQAAVRVPQEVLERRARGGVRQRERR